MPNVSEGRDPAAIAALARACGAATVLDVDPGWDAHRTVLTLAGGDLAEAAFGLARRAVETIDLRVHRGIHVRMGAIDLVPFVPMGGERAACEALAERVGRRIAEELGVPVWRYGLDRRDVRSVRRTGFEALAGTMREIPPDWGPPAPHPRAGAVAVGVRDVLIAFNVCLDSADLGLAKRVARAVRTSSGGLPGVLAIGWETPRYGCVQVSMNLVDWRRTPPHVVLEAIEGLAPVRGCELVGMIPEAAMQAAAAAWGTDLDGVVRRMRLDLVKPFSLDAKIVERRAAALGVAA